MKVELIEEKTVTGTWYFVKTNGNYVSGSLCTDKDEARRCYEIAIQSKKGNLETVLASTDIDPSKSKHFDTITDSLLRLQCEKNALEQRIAELEAHFKNLRIVK